VATLALYTQVDFILLDIEGTTTPVDFVYKMPFPYANAKVESFLHKHFREQEIMSLIEQLHEQYQNDKEQEELQPPSWVDGTHESQLRSAVAYCQWLMFKDIKYTALKSLQGKIWEEGYNKGDLRGTVYPDVPPAFKHWRLQKRQICIYSSGSVLVQQLLFRTVASGDLTPYIAAFFDTRIGSKIQTESYRKIAESLVYSPSNALFISDTVKEVKAAHEAGMQAILCDHDLKASQLSEINIAIIRSFDASQTRYTDLSRKPLCDI
jgi:enolase-phosphatase E1